MVSGVEEVQSVRLRQSGASTFVDLTVGVDRSVSLEEAHEIATAVEGRVSTLARQGDVVVHVNPVQQIGESLTQTVNAVAGRFGLQTHKIRAHEVKGAYFVNLDVEVPANMTLEEAHRRISRLEEELHHELPHIEEINTHIEPLAPRIESDPDPRAKELADLRARILVVIDEVSCLHGCHNIHVWPGPEGYAVVVHCLAQPELPVAQVHDLAEQLKKQLYERLPELRQVLVHVEPDSEHT
jgi:divalent metal cation (Fe/Co/Zn/Cd) transporter